MHPTAEASADQSPVLAGCAALSVESKAGRVSDQDGGPAFPTHQELERYDDERGRWQTYYLPLGGMSMRDYFAGQALAGLMAGVSRDADCRREMFNGDVGWSVVVAYKVADAMLKAREAK